MRNLLKTENWKLKINKRLTVSVLAIILISSGLIVSLTSVFDKTPHAQAAWYSTGGTWNYRKAVTFTANAAKIPSTQSDFPVLISITDAGLAAHAKANGDDILFTSSNATTKLSHEIESYTSATGVLVAWVKVPSLATSGVLYMYYGNASATNQQNKTDVWSNGYVGVWHMGEAAGNILDSTPNLKDGTRGAVVAYQGKVGSGQQFDAGTDNITFSGVSVSLPFNYSTWIYNTGSSYQAIASFGGSQNGIRMIGTTLQLRSTQFLLTQNLYDPISANNWHYISLNFSTSGITPIIDGLTKTTFSYNLTGMTTALNLIGNNSFGQGWSGVIDEANTSSTVRSADWIATEYANQNDPGSFYSLDTEYSGDVVAPSNPTSVTGYSTSGKVTPITTGGYYNYPTPYFEWPAAEVAGGAHDTTGGTYLAGVAGYYSYFGTSCGGGGANPAASRGVLSDTGGGLHYSATTNVTVPDLTTNNGVYCLRMKTADNAGNVSAVSEVATYIYDITAPNAPTFIAANPAGYSSVNSFDFTWPAATDVAGAGSSGIAGYQYKRGNGTDVWSVTQTATSIAAIASYQTGENIFLVRSVDNAGNTSAQVQTTYYYSNAVPTKPTAVTATPGVSDANSFAFSWTAPVHARPIVDYGYSINAVPTTGNLTWTGSASTTLAADAFATIQGLNTFYIVAKDDSGAYGVAEANYGTATFTCTTVAPPIPIAVTITDSSNHTIDLWTLTIAWSAGVGQDPATFDHYAIERSTDGVDFSALATTAGTAYIDSNGLNNTTTYYYQIKAVDNAGATSAASSIVSKMPTGKYATAPTIVSGPSVLAKSTSATISWVVNRTSTSAVRFGTTETDFSRSQISLTTETDHSISLAGLTAGTRYYYQVQSLDEYRDYSSDSAYSPTYNFTTLAAPSIANVEVSNITLTTADITWETSSASNTKVHYGTAIAYTAAVPENNDSMTTRHTVRLINLANTSRYHFKILGPDIDGNILSSDDYVFDTLPMPVISAISYQPDLSGSSPTVAIYWTTNVPTSSSVEYSLLSGDQTSHKENQSALVEGHKVLLSNLANDTEYRFYVSGSDQFGNFVQSDMQILHTNRDSNPPVISGVNIETSNVGVLDDKARVTVSWKTDEPATTQVEYNRGISGDDYALMTGEDSALIVDHSVVISGLDPLVPFRLRVVSKDRVDNIAKSPNATFVTGEVQQSIMILVMRILKNVFGWIKLW